jgi:hypothetical protein
VIQGITVVIAAVVLAIFMMDQHSSPKRTVGPFLLIIVVAYVVLKRE